ncbi:MAG: hypothetical protein KAI17_24080, partial [Thiotrichaceae bacterium]|nr:hypothetical protein [Thiotrichaceae bacterium]
FAEFGTALTPLFDCLVQGLRSDQSVGSVTEFWGVSFDTDPLQAFNAKGVDTMLGPKGNFVSGVDYINIPLMGKVLAGQIIRPHHNSAVTMAAVSATNGLFEITATAKYEDVI